MSSTNKRPLKVFLCHAHADREAVHDLYKRLKREGVDAWLDKYKLLPGQDWEHEIRKAVREVDAIIVCLSKQFNQAGYRQKEVKLALDTALEQPDGEIFIIPARLEECDNLESLHKWHWVDLFEENGYYNLILALRARANTVGATLRNRARKKTSKADSSESDPDDLNGPPKKQTGRFTRSQYEAYTEVWNSLQDLRLVGDDLWSLADEKNLRAFAKQLRETKVIASKAELFLDDDDRRELFSTLRDFERYSGGKRSLIDLRASSKIRQFLPATKYVGFSEEDTHLKIAKQIKINGWMKSQYEKVLDKIRVSYRKRLSGFE